MPRELPSWVGPAALLLVAVGVSALASRDPKPRAATSWAKSSSSSSSRAAAAGSSGTNKRPFPGGDGVLVIGLVGGIASGKSTVAQLLREKGAAIIDADRLGHEAYAPGSPGFAEVVARFGAGTVDPSTGAIDRAKLREAVFGGSGGVESVGGGSYDAKAAAAAAANKADLEAIVWPKVRAAIEGRIASFQAAAAASATQGSGDHGIAGGAPLPPQPVLGAVPLNNRGPAGATTAAAATTEAMFPSRPVKVVVVEAALLLEAGWAGLCDEVWLVGLPDADACLERLLLRDPHLARDAAAVAQARARAQAGQRIRQVALSRGLVDLELDNGGSVGDLSAQVDAAWEARCTGS